MKPDKNIDRQNVYNHVKDFSLVTGFVPQKEFYKNIANSKFTFCPVGNGADTWRFFEALYLRSIPIVKRNRITEFWSKYFDLFIYDDIYIAGTYQISDIKKTACLWINDSEHRIDLDKDNTSDNISSITTSIFIY